MGLFGTLIKALYDPRTDKNERKTPTEVGEIT